MNAAIETILRSQLEERQLRIRERAVERFRRRRAAWLSATSHYKRFGNTLRHPTWRYVEEANNLLLRLP